MIMMTMRNKKPELFSRGKAYLCGISGVTMSISNKNVLFPLPAQNASTLSYNPFSYYDFAVPDNIITACLGTNASGLFQKSRIMHFHNVFASLYQEEYRNYNGILAWIHHFGIPRQSIYRYAEARCKKLNLNVMSIPIIGKWNNR